MPIPSYTTPKQAKMCEGGQPEPKGHEYGWDKPCRSKLDGEVIWEQLQSLLCVSQGSQPESGPGHIIWRGKSRQASLKVLKTRFHT